MSHDAIEEVRRALDSVVWLGINLHNYGSPEWLDYFRAALDDVARARLALELTDRTPSPGD